MGLREAMQGDLVLQPEAAGLRPAEVVVAADSEAAAWDAFVTAHPAATGYHEWAWRGVFERALGHECIYLTARRAGAICGILPLVRINSVLFGRTMTSLPFVNYGGVVADEEADARALVEAAADLARERRCRHVEVRHMARRFPWLPCRQHKVAMLLGLGSDMWDGLDRKVRNQIRKAQKSGLTVTSGGAELLPDFYAVFARNMRDLGTPVQGRRLFGQVLGAFPDRARIHVVRLDGKPVASGMTYRTRHTVEVPWASSIRDFNPLCPNHLLYWNVIETAVAEGCDVLDFGRSTPNEGTYHFKHQWGAQPVALTWEYCLPQGAAVPDQGPTNPKFRTAIGLWQRCPLWLTNVVGPHIVRSIP